VSTESGVMSGQSFVRIIGMVVSIMTLLGGLHLIVDPVEKRLEDLKSRFEAHERLEGHAMAIGKLRAFDEKFGFLDRRITEIERKGR